MSCCTANVDPMGLAVLTLLDTNRQTSNVFIKIIPRGEFTIHPSLKQDPDEAVKNAEWMKIDTDMISKEGDRHWRTPFNSPLGHSTYLAVISHLTTIL